MAIVLFELTSEKRQVQVDHRLSQRGTGEAGAIMTLV